MAITRVNVGAIASANSGNITPVLPAAIASGDILTLVCGSADNVSPTLPGAYTKKVDANGGTAVHLTVAWARATGSDSNPLVTHAAGNSIFAFIVAHRGCAPSGDPFSDFASQPNTHSGGTTITAPTINPLNGDMVIFACAEGEVDTNSGGSQSLSGWSGTNPTFTEFADYLDAGLSNLLVAGGAADGLSTGGATGSRTVTLAIPPTTGSFSVGALLALTAGGAASGPPYQPRRMPMGV